MDACIMHLDIDAFFPSVEQVRLPFLRNRPVVVGSGVIASCSYEARDLGLHAGMPLHQARRLCPHGVYLSGDAQVYKSFAEKIWECCHTLSPAVDTYLDDAYLDMAGTHRLYPNVRHAAAYLKQKIRKEVGLSVTIGIGPSRVVARMAGSAAKPDGLSFIPPHEVDGFLADRPVRDLVGVGSKTARTLNLLGICTIKEMQSLPLDGLKQLFGRSGEVLFARCRGRDGRVIHEREIPNTISRETTFHCATIDPREIRAMLYYLIERGMRTVRQLGLRCRTVGLRIAYSDWVVKSAQRSTISFDLEGRAFDMVTGLLKTLHQRRVSLRRVGITLSSFVPAGGDQGVLFEGEGRNQQYRNQQDRARQERLVRAIDKVRSRFGFKAIRVGPAVELMNRLKWGEHGYILRTPSLTK